MEGTKLETGVVVVSNAASVPVKGVEYYDFRHADANRLLIVAEAVWDNVEEAFKMKLPSNFVFYERSYSHCNKGESGARMYLDEKEISMIAQGVTYGALSPTQLSSDVFHTVKIAGRWYYGPGYPTFGAIVLIYQEP